MNSVNCIFEYSMRLYNGIRSPALTLISSASMLSNPYDITLLCAFVILLTFLDEQSILLECMGGARILMTYCLFPCSLWSCQ